jgi:hypothetical protein
MEMPPGGQAVDVKQFRILPGGNVAERKKRKHMLGVRGK